MAGLASAVLALLILLSSVSARAGDLFTGFQMDGNAQYFAFLGVKENLPWEYHGIKGYAQFFGAGQRYEYESGTRDIEADVQFLIPSLGLTKSLGDGAWSTSAQVGPKLRWKQEHGFPNDVGSKFEVGVFVQADAMYWQETHSVQAIVSYASLDHFFFGRVRGKLRAFSPDAGCCSLFAGMDVAGMGNDDFSSFQIGPLVEVPFGRFFVLARGGYQYDSTFNSGGYGGLEIYTPF
jgi:hypothetical protein